MKEIKLHNGMITRVSDDDFEQVNRFKWSARKNGNTWYVLRRDHSVSGDHRLGMHRQIMSAGTGQIVDHIDGDGLNNQRENLRFCTKAENAKNRKAWGRSRYLGVAWFKRDSKWRAQIFQNKIHKHLGYFDIEEDAAIAYNEAAKRIHGEFARLNTVSA
jgi:hypothetical protein